MRTIGEVLKKGRIKSNKSLKQISKTTRIKERFLQALENNKLEDLPNLPVALGFAKSYAKAVNLDPSFVAALMRRDFPEASSTTKSAEMPLEPQSLWTPKTTIVAVSLLTVFVLGAYLTRQYLLFYSSPPLELQKVSAAQDKVEVQGKTVPAATVEVNGEKVLVGEDGTFTYKTSPPDDGVLEIEAVSRTGKRTVIRKSLVD